MMPANQKHRSYRCFFYARPACMRAGWAEFRTGFSLGRPNKGVVDDKLPKSNF